LEISKYTLAFPSCRRSVATHKAPASTQQHQPRKKLATSSPQPHRHFFAFPHPHSANNPEYHSNTRYEYKICFIFAHI